MGKNDNTRSGLLWEVERLLKECKDLGELPQILIMENVPAVHSKKFKTDWDKWLLVLEDMGYKNYWSDMNAKDYGVPQSRNRAFMISILNKNAKYEFPETIPLNTCMKDYLEQEVDEKYYLNTPKAKALIEKLLERGGLKDLPIDVPLGNITPADNDKIHQRNFIYNENGMSPTLTHTMYKDPPRVMLEIKRLGNIYRENEGGNFGGNAYDPSGLCPTINVMGGGNRQPIIIEKEQIIVASRGRNVENPSDRRAGIELEQRLEARDGGICGCLTSVPKDNMVLERTKTQKEIDRVEVIKDGYAYRIRKITPREGFRLMDFSDAQFDRAEKVASNSALYGTAGNSIVVNCLVALIGQMIDGREDYYKVDNSVDKVDKIKDE